MRIQHNISAMNSYRNYSNNVSQVSKNLEKLSTGYKVNRAGDDAAGLAISEKMRIQITGLEKAQSNAKAGINLVQTAEGALAEVHDMLNRMYDLAEQSANGTFDDTTDRKQLQKEVDSLREEIDRIADSTNYNGIQLLDGSMDRKTVSSSVKDLFDIDQTNSTLQVIQDGDPGQKAQAGVFELNLKDVTLTSKAANEKLTLNIFGLDEALDLGTYSKGESISGEKLVNAIVEAWNKANPDVKGDADVKMTASVSLDKDKVVFTMNNPPAKDWNYASDVTFNTTDANTAGGYTINGAQSLQVRVDVEPVATDKPRTYAQAKFDLSKQMIADGRTIQIGDETYVFAVGRNSAYKDMDHIIDLTDFAEEDFGANGANKNLKTAAMRLTEAASGNAMFKVSTQTGDDVIAGTTGVTYETIYLTEREDAVDYTVNDLKGKATDPATPATAKDGNWTGLVKTGIVDSDSSTNGLTLQIGDTSEKFNQLNVSIKDMHVSALNLSKINIGEQDGAQTAMDIIKAATNYVSDVRGGLGALQNRLDHTINNLSVAQENIQDAESVIRDVDVADEMMAYTKNNILVQSAQAMLAQANQLPQGVLQLLG